MNPNSFKGSACVSQGEMERSKGTWGVPPPRAPSPSGSHTTGLLSRTGAHPRCTDIGNVGLIKAERRWFKETLTYPVVHALCPPPPFPMLLTAAICNHLGELALGGIEIASLECSDCLRCVVVFVHLSSSPAIHSSLRTTWDRPLFECIIP